MFVTKAFDVESVSPLEQTTYRTNTRQRIYVFSALRDSVRIPEACCLFKDSVLQFDGL